MTSRHYSPTSRASSADRSFFAADAILALSRRPWAGNVRELRTLVERAVVFTDHEIISARTLAEIEGDIAPPRTAPARSLAEIVERVLELPIEGDRLEAVEQALITLAMTRAGGNKSTAAELLGIHRKRVQRRWPAAPDDA